MRGIRTRRTSLADELAIHMFGHLNGNDFASDVHDILDGTRVRFACTGLPDESVTGVRMRCVRPLGAVALFAFSFM